MLTQAYFDASGTHESAKDLCLAGYIFKDGAASRFDQEWRSMLAKYDVPHFHMKECAHASGVFKHLGHDRCDLAARDAIDLIKSHVSQGIAFTVDKSIAAELRKGSVWSNEYSFIVGQVFFAIRDWAIADPSRNPVSCLFESGDEGRGQAIEAAQAILKHSNLKEECRLASFSWADRNEETPLQAADMLAWHVNLWRGRRRKGVIKKRADFKSLLAVPMVYHHWDRSAVDVLKAIRGGRKP
jgi:hypothetical protein